MDIHKPKAAHSWREFLIEIGTIVCGIVIALGLEQAVDWLHWSHEVKEARSALDGELSNNLFAFDFDVAKNECVTKRLAQIQHWVDLKRQGRFTPLKSRIDGPSGFNLHFAVWEDATGEARAHIPLEARMTYAKLYDALKARRQARDTTDIAWDRLSDFRYDAATSEDELQSIEGQVRRLQGDADSLANYRLYIEGLAHDLGIKPQVLPGVRNVDLQALQREACAPLF